MTLREIVETIRTQPLNRGGSEFYIFPKTGWRIRAIFLGVNGSHEAAEAIKSKNLDSIPEDCEDGELEYLRIPLDKDASPESLPLSEVDGMYYLGERRRAV